MNITQQCRFSCTRSVILSALFCFTMLCLHPAFSQQWKQMRYTSTGAYLTVFFLDSLHGWVGGDAKSILYTTDGGTRWDSCNTIEGDINNDVHSIHFFDVNNGLATLGKFILKSSDGGKNWLPIGKAFLTEFAALQFVTEKRGWAVGTTGGVWFTTDGGKTWDKQPTPIGKDLYTVFFTDTLNGWIGGRDATFLHTTNGGKTWKAEKPVTLEATAYINAIDFCDNLHGWAVGVRNRSDGQYQSDLIIATTDGGKTWAEQPTQNLIRLQGGAFGVSFADTLHGWVVGSEGFILKTTDGGASWKVNLDGLTRRYPYFRAVTMLNENYGFAVGVGCAIVRYSPFISAVEQETEHDTEQESENESPNLRESVAQNLSTVVVYPQPVRDKATLYYKAEQPVQASITIYDIQGAMLSQFQESINTAGVAAIELPVQALSAGSYIVRINTGNKVEARVFIISK